MKKIFLFFVIGIFLILSVQPISAFQFSEIDNIKSYDKTAEKIEIKDSFLWIFPTDNILSARLETPRVYGVGVGYQKVAQFTIIPQQDYKNVIGEFEFYDLNSKKKIEKQIDIKYLTYEKVEIKTHNNETGKDEISYKEKEVWKDYDNSLIIDKQVTIGLFTIVGVDDRIEWIPRIAGVKINEWAVYEYVQEAHGVALTGEVDGTYKKGIQFFTYRNMTIYNVTKSANSDAQFCNLTDSTHAQLTSGLFSGNLCTFANTYNLTKDNYYYIETDRTTSGTLSYFNPAVFNISGKYINWTKGWDNPGLADTIYDTTGIGTRVFLSEGITIALNSPADNYNSNISSVIFNCSMNSIDGNVLNLTLLIDDIDNSSVYNISSGESGLSLEITRNLSEYEHNWTCRGESDYPLSSTASVFNLTIDTSPAINFTSPTPESNINLSTDSLIINVSLTEIYFKNLTFFLYNSSGLYDSAIYTSNTRFHNFTSIKEGDYNYSAEIWTTTGRRNSTETRFITLGTESPIINVTYPFGNIDYKKFGENVSIEWTVSDLHLQSCLGSFDRGINNFSLTCLDKNYSSIITSPINNSFFIWANDSLGNSASFKRNWNYSVFEWNQTFVSPALEGNSETFSINISYDNYKFTNIQGTLVYNNTKYLGTKYIYGENLVFNKTLSVPTADVQVNNSFYWEFLLDSTYINSSFQNQTINTISLDDCSAYSTMLYNYTMFDEETKTKLFNTTIKVSLELWDSPRTIKIATLNASYKNINPVRICLNNILGKSVNFSADSIIQYTANYSINENVTSIYAIEYYNILRQEITNNTVPINTKLFGLLLEDSTEFQLTFRNSDYALAPDIIVYLYRQYVEDNDFKVVEAPLTDSNGQTILHMVRNDVVYNLLMADKTGRVIATFNKIIAFCQDYTIGNCIILLNARTGGDTLYDYTDDLGISYTTPTYSNATDLITFDFVSNDLSSKTIMTEVIKNSPFGNRSICTDTLTSASGTITCNVSAVTETDRFLFINIYVDGDLKVHSGIDLESGDTGTFGLVNGAFIAFLIILFLICMFMEDKSALVFSLIIGWAIVCGLGLINGTIIWAVSGGIWLLVTAIIFLWKLKKEETG